MGGVRRLDYLHCGPSRRTTLIAYTILNGIVHITIELNAFSSLLAHLHSRPRYHTVSG